MQVAIDDDIASLMLEEVDAMSTLKASSPYFSFMFGVLTLTLVGVALAHKLSIAKSDSVVSRELMYVNRIFNTTERLFVDDENAEFTINEMIFEVFVDLVVFFLCV